MIDLNDWRAVRILGLAALILAGLASPAWAQTASPAPATPSTTAPAPATPSAAVPAPAPSDGKSQLGTSNAPPAKTQIENNAAPGIPDNATTENVDVPARPVALITGQSTYDDAFKSIKASLDTLNAAIAKAGLTASGHPVTIFSEPDENGFKYQAAVPLTAKPDGKDDLGNGVKIGTSPAGKAIKFQHRGAYDDIDSTYDVITAYLDAKGLQVDNPYIEEYLTELKTPDDPNLQVDIYVFMK
ncbi:MAG: GyrI-like domain-containing protein [Beijerinckiaceae bacterium]|nr:GyrI-like domain-containing protein [Beijerinckiaceae bacterium]